HLAGDGNDDPVRDTLHFRGGLPGAESDHAARQSRTPARNRRYRPARAAADEAARYARIQPLLQLSARTSGDLLMAVIENLGIADPHALARSAARRERLVSTIVPIGTAVALVGLWQLGVRAFGVPTYIAPAPSDVAVTLVEKY